MSRSFRFLALATGAFLVAAQPFALDFAHGPPGLRAATVLAKDGSGEHGGDGGGGRSSDGGGRVCGSYSDLAEAMGL